MKKTFVSLMLVLVLVISLLPAGALADESGTWGGIDWTLTDDGTLIIAPTVHGPVPDSNSGKTYEVGEWREAVRYDSKGNGLAIAGWPYDRSKVTKLVIEEGVTSIGSFTAQNFKNLKGEVIIPSTVTYIGQEAFQGSTFTKLTFAAGGTKELCIAQGAFKNLIIEEVALPADRPVHIHAWVFNNCHNLKHATLPATLTTVWGTNHIDYFKDFNAHSNPTWTRSSELFAYNENMETVTFGSESVRDTFFANQNGTAKDYLLAYSGLTAYANLQDAIDAAANGDGKLALVKNYTIPKDETITIPQEVSIIIPEGKKLTNNGTIYLAGEILGSFSNNGTVIEAYIVTFLADDKIVATVSVFPGEDAALPTIPAKSGYSARWNHDGKNIRADMVITAIYSPIPLPKTGDNSTPMLWLALVVLSASAALMMRRKAFNR